MSWILLCLYLFFSAHTEAQTCKTPRICHELARRYNISSSDPKNRAKFRALLDIARDSLAPECRVRGTQRPIPNYQACYFQGFIERNGKFAAVPEAPYPEEEVMKWFSYIENSNHAEGESLIESDAFVDSLSDSWLLRFAIAMDEYE